MRIAIIAGLAAAAIAVLCLLPPIPQDPAYHVFADQRTIWGIPNFWNVVTNLPFLLVALWGMRALGSRAAFLENWERVAYACLLAGVGMVAFGSSYYHAWPDNATLFWDRLPMTVVFMALLAITIGERIHPGAGRALLLPLLALGAASVIYWRFSGDLRLYVIVQFYPMLALPLMLLLFPPTYTGTAGIWAMIGGYAIAKVLEYMGMHPSKHVAGALAMLCYVDVVRRRKTEKRR